MTTDASPHTMPSIVSTERRRLRIRACQPCEMSSFRNMAWFSFAAPRLLPSFHHPMTQLPKDPIFSVDSDVSRPGVHADFRASAVHLSANGFPFFLHPSLDGGGHGVAHLNTPRAGGNVEVKRCLIGHTEL